jgi:acyl-CoA reductase-like NAD-dependent aldehyde dehydrogenase
MHTLDAKDFALLIDGQLRGGARRVPVINPSTGDVLVESPSASSEQLQDAINAAQRAYAHWKHAPMETRRATVNRIADLMADHQEELSRLLMLEAGKPMPVARAEVTATIGYFRHFATLELSDEIIEDSDTRHVRIVREPLGVVAAIVAWNFPLLLLAFKLPPALLAGNAVVVKPATTTPLATLHLGRLIAEHLPPGLVNVLAGDDDLGPHMTAHRGFRKISFTGSTATGRRVMSSAAPHLTRVTLELGGNDPAIVFDDVDVEDAAKRIFAAAFGHSGQVCRAIKRVYAHEKIHDALVQALAKLATEVKVARADEDDAEMGPVQNLAQYRRLKELLEEARTLGKVVGSASIPSGPGYFIPPTIVTQMPSDRCYVGLVKSARRARTVFPILCSEGVWK